MSKIGKRNLKWLLLLALPIGLGIWLLVLREQRSWMPRVVYKMKTATDIAISPDGKWLAVSGNPTAKGWRTSLIDAQSGRLRFDLAQPTPSQMMSFSPEGEQIVIGNFLASKNEQSIYRLTFYDVRNGNVQRQLDLPNFTYVYGSKLVWSAKSAHIFVLSEPCLVVDVNSGAVARFSLGIKQWNDIELGPDQTFMVSVKRRNESAKILENGAAHLWDARSGKLLRTIGKPQASSREAAFSNDGKLMAADVTLSGAPMVIQLWDVKSGKPLRNLKALTGTATPLGMSIMDYPRRLQFSPTKNLLAIPAIPDSIVLWNADTGKVERTLKGTRKTILADFCFSSNGKFLVTAMNNGTITRWRIR